MLDAKAEYAESENLPVMLVCGGRDFDEASKEDRSFVYNILDNIVHKRGYVDYGEYSLPEVKIVHGGARGVDRIAEDWAIVNWCPFRVYKADWDTYGKAAGPIRNQEMLDEEHPDLVVAFPGGRGTQDMIDRARKQGYEVAAHER
jgi:hypothetical protein